MGTKQNGRQMRLGGRPRATIRVAIGIGAAAVGAAITVAVAVPVGAAGAAPRAVSRAVSRVVSGRAHWAPVPYRNAQLSVPGSWLVETPAEQTCLGTRSGGMIFTGMRPRLPKGEDCALTDSVAWMVPAGHIPPSVRHRKPTALINGIPVYRLRSGQGSVLYLAPKLGVRVGARGPRAERVLATLTRSPLSVVLGHGAASPVPGSWTWHLFGGIRFAAPSSWTPQHSDQWATCGTGLLSRTLLLIDATKPPAALPCPYPIPLASAERAQPGLTVVTGKYAAESVARSYPRCAVRRGIRICLSSVTGQGGFYSSVLIFSVSKAHRHARTFFLLGLSGSGSGPRAVFDSITVAGA